MAQRVVVFLITVLMAVCTGLFVRRGEQEASSGGKLWPGPAELGAQDRLVRLRPRPAPRPDIVIVAADDKSVAKFGKLPWNRATWSSGLARVQAGSPKVSIFDIALDKRTTREADRRLYERLSAQGRRIVLGLGYDASRPATFTPGDVRALRFLERHALTNNVTLRGASAVQPFAWPLFEPPVSDFTQQARGVGVFVRETDQDAVIRHARLLYLSQVKTPATTPPLSSASGVPPSPLDGFTVALPGLALAGARQALGVDKTSVSARNDAVTIGGGFGRPFVVPVDGSSRMVINYAGPAGTYPVYSLADVASGTVPATTFKDKVVLFGATAAGAEETDRRLTPYGGMPRVEITANAIGSILGRAPLVRSRGGDVLAALVAVGVVAGLLLAQSRPARVFLTGLGLTLLYFVVAWALLTYARLLAPLLPALFVLAASTLIATAVALVQQARSRRFGESLISGDPV